jgi:hypothetical protein
MVADAHLVEAGFEAKLASFGDPPPGDGLEEAQNPLEAQSARPYPNDTKPLAALPKAIGTRPGRATAKTIRLRDKDHRRFVSTQPCLVCGRSAADAHHLRFAQPRALGRKVSDEFIVPLCRVHHRQLHRQGTEASWWSRNKIDPLPIARRLWRHARTNGTGSAADGDGPEPNFATAANGSGSARPDPVDPEGQPAGNAGKPASP